MSNLPLPAEMPELLYPNRTPTGNVKIDWSNKLAKGIVGMNLLYSGKGLENLVADEKANWVNSYKQTTEGIDFRPNGYMQLVTGSRCEEVLRACNNFTITFIGLSFTGTSNLVVCEGGTLRGVSVLTTGASGTITTVIGSYPEGWIEGTEVKNNGIPFNLTITYDGTIQKIYYDGVLGETKAHTEKVGTKSWYLGSRLGTHSYFGTMIGYVVHDKALSEAGVNNLGANPYQVLIPA